MSSVLSIRDASFAPLGRAVSGVPLDGLRAALQTLPLPDSGMTYHPREDCLHAQLDFEPWGAQLFADLPYQLGWCAGSNERADCLVRHGGSGFLWSETAFDLLLAPRWDPRALRRFRVPAQTLVELYGDTLRSAPLGTGFRLLAILPYATNTAYSAPDPLDPALYARNTWRIALTKEEQP